MMLNLFSAFSSKLPRCLALTLLLVSLMPSAGYTATAEDDDILDLILPIITDPYVVRLGLYRSAAPTCQSTPNGPFDPSIIDVNESEPVMKQCAYRDMTLFNGLLCASGETGACAAVKRAQKLSNPDKKLYGRWYRSPYRLLNPDQFDNKTFSPDMDLGAQIYAVITNNRTAFSKWLDWLENNRPCTLGKKSDGSCILGVKGTPRYCFHSDCTLRPEDATFLTETAHYFNLTVPQGIQGIPKINTASMWIWLGANVNNVGFPLHLVGGKILLMRLMHRGNAQTLQNAAKILVSRQPKNPFFRYLRDGPTQAVRNLTFSLCPANSADIAATNLSEWAWQRADSEQAWKESSLWDCMFMVNLLKKGEK